jgi:hypothetical protein
MEQNQINRRNFFKTATVAGAAAAAYSWEEYDLLAFQRREGGAPPQGGAGGPGAAREGGAPGQGAPGGARGGQQVVIPDIPGPVPTVKIGGLQISRLIAGHNLVVGQAHEGGSGLVYISALLRAYFTEAKVLETFSMYEKHGINCSGARMATNNSDWAKKYMAQGGKLSWLAGISSEKDIPMAVDMGSKLGYVHGNTADAAIRSATGADSIAKLLDAIRKAKMVGGVCCHSIDVVTICEKAGIKPDFYIKTFNPVNYSMSGGGVAENAGARGAEGAPAPSPAGGANVVDQAARDKAMKITSDIMASVKVPFIGFKVLGAGRANPSQAFPEAFKNGCDALLVGMYDFQVAADANLVKKLLLEKDKLGRTRPWVES